MARARQKALGDRRLKRSRLTASRPAARPPISPRPTPRAVKTPAALLGSARSVVRPDQSLSMKMCATRATLARMRTASGLTSAADRWRIAKAAPSRGEPWRTRISSRRRQDRYLARYRARYRAAEDLAAEMGMTEVRMFVIEPQPERVAGVLRPVVSGNRRGEVIMVEERRIRSQKGEVVLGKLAQHRADLRRVGRRASGGRRPPQQPDGGHPDLLARHLRTHP